MDIEEACQAASIEDFWFNSADRKSASRGSVALSSENSAARSE